MVDDFTKLVTSKFQMSMIRGIIFFLGLHVKQVPKGIFIDQEKYTNELLKKYLMDNNSLVKVPMTFSYKITADSTRESVYPIVYRGMIGSLLYRTASRPDIVFITG